MLARVYQQWVTDEDGNEVEMIRIGGYAIKTRGREPPSTSQTSIYQIRTTSLLRTKSHPEWEISDFANDFGIFNLNLTASKSWILRVRRYSQKDWNGFLRIPTRDVKNGFGIAWNNDRNTENSEDKKKDQY